MACAPSAPRSSLVGSSDSIGALGSVSSECSNVRNVFREKLDVNSMRQQLYLQQRQQLHNATTSLHDDRPDKCSKTSASPLVNPHTEQSALNSAARMVHEAHSTGAATCAASHLAGNGIAPRGQWHHTSRAMVAQGDGAARWDRKARSFSG